MFAVESGCRSALCCQQAGQTLRKFALAGLNWIELGGLDVLRNVFGCKNSVQSRKLMGGVRITPQERGVLQIW